VTALFHTLAVQPCEIESNEVRLSSAHHPNRVTRGSPKGRSHQNFERPSQHSMAGSGLTSRPARAEQRQMRNSRSRHHPRKPLSRGRVSILLLLSTILHLPAAQAVTMLPLRVTNNCKEPVWPAILSQDGTPPASSGFRLDPGETNALEVGLDWKGRVWARTNCSFPDTGSAPASGQGGAPCQTGDCGTFLQCQGAVGDSIFC